MSCGRTSYSKTAIQNPMRNTITNLESKAGKQLHNSSPSVTPVNSSTMLNIQNVTHRYGAVVALDGVSLAAFQGEFLTVLGESGSGKTTLLRVISGLETPSDGGRVEIDGVDVSTVPAARRNCTTVFQNYALFPHMSVQQNVEYGLSVRGVSRDECNRRASDSLAMVRLSNHGSRRINQLSGGEMQRVALARALVTQPAILLLDEPLGALDEKLRQEMQAELVDLHRELSMTFIYITHSQEEALTMSDRIALMRGGQIVQSGSPEDLFDRPNSRFCANFMGFENIFPVTIVEMGGDSVGVSLGEHSIRGIWTGAEAAKLGQPAFAAIRAERMKVGGAKGGGNADAVRNQIECRPRACQYRGKYVDQVAEAAFGTVRVRIWDRDMQFENFRYVSWYDSDCVVFPS